MIPKATPWFVIGIIVLIPVYWMVKGSFQDIAGLLIIPPQWLPWGATLKNYQKLVTEAPFWRWVGNSLVITSIAIGASVFANGTAAYGLHKLRKAPRWRTAVGTLIVITIALNRQLFVIPNYITLSKAGLGGTWFAVIAPTVYMPAFVLIAERMLRILPESYIDAGRIDGAGEWQLFFRVIVPIMKPALALIAVFTGIMSFQDYMWQFLQLKKMPMQTLPVGLITQVISAAGLYGNFNPIGMYLAAGTILFVPMMVIFIMFRKLILSNTTRGGLGNE